MSNDVLKDYIDELSRWGRWGPDDELGALNLLTPQHVQAAAKEVMAGRVISMTLPYDQAGPQQGGLRHNPMLLATATGTDVVSGKQQELFSAFGIDKTRFGYADDSLIMPTQCGTQWDALAHIFHDGRMWNGYSAAEHTTAGAARNAIQHWTDRMILRGVLIDVARHKGVPALEPGYAITPDDLDETLEAQGSVVGRGDAVFVRTGQLGKRRGSWGDYAGGSAPASPCTPLHGWHRRKLSRSPPTPGAWRSGPTRSRNSSPCTKSPSSTWDWPSVRCSTSTRWPWTADRTAATASCSPRPPCP